MNQIDRITHYEEILDKGEEVVYNLLDYLNKYEDLKHDLKKLEKYYSSKKYLKDLESDNSGELPSNLKRGVLGEDYVYNLFMAIDEVEKRIK